MRMVHGVAASEHTAVCNQLWQGAHTLLGEHFEWTGFISASKTASEGALGLVHHRGRCRGQVDWAAAGSVRRAAQGASYEEELAHGAALSAYRSQHKPGGEVVRTETPVDGVVHTLPVDEASDEADVIRRTR